MKSDFVTIRHPELGAESTIHRESIPVWVELGWELITPLSVPGSESDDVLDSNEESDEPSLDSEEE